MAFNRFPDIKTTLDYQEGTGVSRPETSVDQVGKLIRAAGDAENPDDAMRFSQAALNAAKAIETLGHAGHIV